MTYSLFQCFSDIASISGKVRGKFPAIYGHEGSGIIESVGENVTDLQSGDHVLIVFLPQCRKCRVCEAGVGNVCLQFMMIGLTGLMKDGTSRITCRGQEIYNFMGTSTFTEYTVVSANNCVKINPHAPLEKICLLSCGIPTGYGGAINSAKVREGSSCAVFGLGAIGLATVMGCHAMKASKIIGIDINSDKFEIAKKLGATNCVNPRELDMPIADYLKQNFQGGVDFSFECIGLVETIKQAYDSIIIGHGVCVLIGIAPSDKSIDIIPIQLQIGKSLIGSFYGGYRTQDDVPRLVDQFMDGKLDLDTFITHEMQLEKINEAIDLLKDGKCVRTVISL